MAKAVKAGEAYVELGVRSNIDRGLRAAQAQMKKFGTNLTRVGAAVTGLGAAVGGPLIAMTNSFATAGAALGKLSTQTGVAVAELSALRYASGQVGVDFDDTAGAIEEFNIRMGETLQDGVGPAADAFRQLGINAAELTKLPLAEQIGLIGDSLNQLPRTQRQFLADEIFGGDAFKIMSLLDQGSEGIAKMGREAEEMGLIMGGNAARSAQEYQAAMARLTGTVAGLKNQIGAALAPALTRVADFVARAVSGIVKFARENKGLIQIIGATAAIITGIGLAVTAFGGFMLLASAAVGGLVATLGLLLNPITLVVGGLAALAIAVMKYTNTAGAALQWLADRFGPLVTTIKSAFKAIAGALLEGNFSKAFELVGETLEMIWLDLTQGMYETWDWAMRAILTQTVKVAKMIGLAFRMLARIIDELLVSVLKRAGSEFNVLSKIAQQLPGGGTIAAALGAASGVTQGAAVGVENNGTAFTNALDKLGKMTISGAEAFDRAGTDELDARKKAREDRLAKLRKDLTEQGEGALDDAFKFMKDFEAPKFEDNELLKPAATIGTRGAFSGAAAALLGGPMRSPMERTARNTEKMVAQQEKTNKKLENVNKFAP